MDNYNKKLIERIDYVIEQWNTALSKAYFNDYNTLSPESRSMFDAFRSSGLSLILNLYTKNHPYYEEFDKILNWCIYRNSIESSIAIITNIKSEIENGWILSTKSIISAEIFSDFLEMADHLLENNYKDASAVIIGGVLEEHLRQLCIVNEINIFIEKNGRVQYIAADTMNNDLSKKWVYDKLDQKNITAQLDLRNNAAHGHYESYDIDQVKIMYKVVLDFISKYKIV